MGERLNILCISSSRDANLLRKLLRDTPFQGSRLYHVASIAKASLTRSYDLIITDFLEGIETLSTLKQAYPETPLLYFGDNEALADRAVNLGAQDYLAKEEIDAIKLNRIITFAIEREVHQSKLREKTFTDDLTGVYNRRGFNAFLKQQMELTKRSNQGFILFMFDLDFFKEINDSHGHPAGDQALIHTAQVLQKSFRSHDIIARIGGDEFAVLALNSRVQGKEAFKRELLDRLRELNAQDLPYSISLSMGSVYYNGGETTEQGLMEAVDKELYNEKKKRHQLLRGEDKM